MKLTPKLALVFVSFAGTILLGVGTLVYFNGRSALEAATFAELQSTSLEKSAAVDAWFAERKSDISALSRSPVIIEEMEKALGNGPDSTSAEARLIRELSVRTGQGQEYLAFLILAPDTGEPLLATSREEKGTPSENQDYYVQGKTTSFVSKVYYSAELQAPAMMASAPLRGEDGKLLGVLVGRLNLEELNTIIQRRSGLRKTDDAFLVNTSNLFVTQPYLLRDPAVLLRGAHTQAVRQCLQTRSAGTLFALDYLKQPSLITYRWLPDHEMCLIVKMSRAEALAPIQAFTRTTIWIALVTLMIASIVAMVLSGSMLRPILEMQTVVQRYGRGDRQVRLPETRSDELGALAHKFNRMAVALAENEFELRMYAETLEQRIQERTKELQESNAQLSRAQEIAHLGSWELDLVYNRLIWSDEVYRIFGLQPQAFDATYEGFLEAVHPEDRAAVDAAYSESIQAGKNSYEIEHRVVRHSTGEIRIVHEKCEHFRNAQGQIIRSAGMVHDITERKQAEEKVQRSEAMLRAILEQMPSGVTVRDAHSGELILSNHRSREILNTLVETPHQFDHYRGFHADGTPYRNDEWPLSRSLATGEVVQTEEIYCMRSDETRIVLSISSAPVRDLQGQIVMGIGVFDDITERKHTEEELHRLLEQLKYSNAELEQFAYVASHDLQEPLRMVSSYMQLLARRYQGKLDPDADEFIGFAVDGAKRMQTLINDLLTFSRVGSRGKPLVHTSGEEALQEAISNLQIAIEESGASITHERLPQVKGDPTQLVQLFQNLLSNAIKFRGLEPPRIQVGVHQTESEWRFCVSDNGIGIDPKFADRIFVIFQRLHDRASYPGTGIGLAICKRIVQRHGGRIWVEAQPGMGATFYFTLPSKETL